NIGIHFSVIDKGLRGTNTPTILNNLESYLAQYHPDMVVAMMGLNDKGEHITVGVSAVAKDVFSIESLQTYKLARLLWLHIMNKAREAGLCSRNNTASIKCKEYYAEPELAEISLRKIAQLNPEDDHAYLERGSLCRSQGEFDCAEELFKKAIKLNPGNINAYIKLGRLYQEQNQFVQAEQLFKKALDYNSHSIDLYLELGKCYWEQSSFSQAEETFKEAIKLNPDNDSVYVGLGRVYLEQGKITFAQEAFRKALELNPQNDNAYAGLGWLYRGQLQFFAAEEAFRKALELNPKNDDACAGLGRLYLFQHKNIQAESLFKKIIELNPGNDRTYRAILALYEESGRMEQLTEYIKKAGKLNLWSYYNPVTVHNYRRLKDILSRQKIKLVCVQYPVRSVEPLKKIFPDDKGVIFVDNEKIFKEALQKSGYKEYFRDMCAGDFGHCTEKGNRLLAENIACTILKEVFNK
ncbi:MAG: tetratricopeptide repeat protein, partial [Candidatus Omnitrophica bacterium]|nr:tetratricopeptide repeat protein [Candidatus Omnitrophota bacterium]